MSEPVFPFLVESPSGMRVQVNANGSLRRLDHHDILVNSYLGNEVEGGPANLYLRRLGDTIEAVPLLGPQSPSRVEVSASGLVVRGEWRGLEYVLTLQLPAAAPTWFWQGSLYNSGAAEVVVDVIYAQDLSLAHYGAVRMNEYYCSQYVDYTPLQHPQQGTVLAVRQNLSMGGRNPWVLVGSLRRGASFATDALQLHGLATRAGAAAAALLLPSLPSRRLQHEHSMAVIQDEPQRLAPGETAAFGFFGWFEADHPTASSAADVAFFDQALELSEVSVAADTDVGVALLPGHSLFGPYTALPCCDLDEVETAEFFGGDWRNVERDGDRLLSLFCGADRHVVLRAKELQTLRPHGHLLRSGDHLVPDEASLTSTTWMNGVFHSMVTQGHVSINRFLSTSRSYLGLQRAAGQRVFVEVAGGLLLLDVPSAYEMSPSGCRWIYKHAGGVFEVCAWAVIDRHELHLSLAVLRGEPCRFLVTHNVALNGDDGAEPGSLAIERDDRGVRVRATLEGDVSRRFPDGYFRIDPSADTPIEAVTGDEVLFDDGQTRRQPFVCLRTAPTRTAAFAISGHLIPSSAEPALAMPRSGLVDEQRYAAPFHARVAGAVRMRGADDAVGPIQDILPWLAHNALVHYLAPRGLEQFSGGGWGTRDVCQGPAEMMLALGEWGPLRDLLLRVFRQQNADGDWPQWFMFFERERNIRPGDSHGDIVFWPVLALAQYLVASEDAAILEEVVPYFHADGDAAAEHATLWQHAERALQLIERRVIPETRLSAYGHGDWNDSLQPVDPAMCEYLCSAWTVTLCVQTLATLAAALDGLGQTSPAADLAARARLVQDQFQQHLIVDGTITGYADFREPQRVAHLLHPSDRTTGIRYSLLPMIHAVINDMLTPEQLRTHVAIIEEHLLGADGARLFDRPFDYNGGPQRHFQRAESSTFFGREIGILYTHAHLRYAEAMAHCGSAEAFFRALRQATPIGLQEFVPTARRRQANCYYSSSDAAFADRYQALADYGKVKSGTIAFEGGWRVYSSGAGIALRLIHECLLGIRRRKSTMVFDPVLPRQLDGLQAELSLCGAPVEVEYLRGNDGCGVTALTLNGREVPFTRVANPYRTGGALVSVAVMQEMLLPQGNHLRIELA